MTSLLRLSFTLYQSAQNVRVRWNVAHIKSLYILKKKKFFWEEKLSVDSDKRNATLVATSDNKTHKCVSGVLKEYDDDDNRATDADLLQY